MVEFVLNIIWPIIQGSRTAPALGTTVRGLPPGRAKRHGKSQSRSPGPNLLENSVSTIVLLNSKKRQGGSGKGLLDQRKGPG